eukprot:523025-Pelagomonas_calceolata.AAC.1
MGRAGCAGGAVAAAAVGSLFMQSHTFPVYLEPSNIRVVVKVLSRSKSLCWTNQRALRKDPTVSTDSSSESHQQKASWE